MSSWFGRVGSSGALPEKMPSIWLVTDPSRPESEARRVADGCEEEGTPLAWDVRKGRAEDLARSACLSSQLEVGIGIGPDGNAAIALVSVTGKPYIELAGTETGQLRWLGQAAARISKSQPIPERANVKPAQHAEETAQSSDFESLAQMATAALLREIQKGGD